MARSFNGTTDYADAGTLSALDSVTSCSFGGWCYRSGTGITVGFGQYLEPYRCALVWYSDSSCYIACENGSASYPNFTQSVSGWHHILIVYDGSQTGVSRLTAYFDGASQTITAGGASPSASLAAAANQSAWRFGMDNSIADRFWGGGLAEIAVWPSTILTAAEAAVLAAAYSPQFVRPGSLQHYWPLIGRSSPEVDVWGGAGATLTGTTGVNHPRIIYPRRKTLVSVPATAAASTIGFLRDNAGCGAAGAGPFARANAGLGAVA